MSFKTQNKKLVILFIFILGTQTIMAQSKVNVLSKEPIFEVIGSTRYTGGTCQIINLKTRKVTFESKERIEKLYNRKTKSYENNKFLIGDLGNEEGFNKTILIDGYGAKLFDNESYKIYTNKEGFIVRERVLRDVGSSYKKNQGAFGVLTYQDKEVEFATYDKDLNKLSGYTKTVTF